MSGSSAIDQEKKKDRQQMTALHMMASSRKVLDNSFSRANVRLLPSVNDMSSLLLKGKYPATIRTDNQGEILEFTCTSLIFDGRKAFLEEF